MKKITSLAICLFACSSLSTATAQTAQQPEKPKLFPENQRLTPEQVKAGNEFLLCTVSPNDNSNFFDRSNKETGDFINFSSITAASKLKAEPAGGDKFYIKCVSTNDYLAYDNNRVKWVAEKSEAKTFTIESVSRQQYTAPWNGYDIVAGGFGASNAEKLIRIRDNNKIFNSDGRWNKAKFAAGTFGYTVFVPYAARQIDLNRKEGESISRVAFDGYTVGQEDVPNEPNFLGLLKEGEEVDYRVSAANTSFSFNYLPLKATPGANKIHYIKGETRGFLFYNATGTNGKFVWSTAKNPQTTFDHQSPNFKWVVFKTGGKQYLYNIGAQKFAVPLAKAYSEGSYSGSTWVFSSIPAPIDFEPIEGKTAYSRVRSNNIDLSISVDYTGPCISYYEAGDGGVPFTFIQTSDNLAEVRAKIAEKIGKLEVPFSDGGDGYKYATFYGDSHVALPENAGVEVYIATGNNAENKITLQKKETNVLPAGQGVLLRKKDDSILHLEVVYNHSQIPTFTGNLLRGTVEENVPTEGSYVLNKKEGQGVGFYQLSAPTLPPYKATLPASAVGTGGAPVLFDWTVTGLNGLSVEGNKAGAIYDLLGRPAAKATKGLYIVNGKKVLF